MKSNIVIQHFSCTTETCHFKSKKKKKTIYSYILRATLVKDATTKFLKNLIQVRFLQNLISRSAKIMETQQDKS